MCSISPILQHDAQEALETAFKLKNILTPPATSNFRVFVMVFHDDQKCKPTPFSGRFETGTNGEACNVSSAVCAERAALLKLLEAGTLHTNKITSIVLVSDSKTPITPGPLCLEFLYEHCPPDVPILMGGDDRGRSAPVTKISTLRYLFPFPHIYRGQHVSNLVEFAKAFSSKMQLGGANSKCISSKSATDVPPPLKRRKCENSEGKTDVEWLDLYNHVLDQTSKDNRPLHPISLAAGLLFSDNSITTAWQTKANEFGCSLDPVSKLTVDLDRTRDCKFQPRYLLQVDQFGVLHAPEARARSLILEGGYNIDGLKCVIHNDDGKVCLVSAKDLLPDIPDIMNDLKEKNYVKT